MKKTRNVIIMITTGALHYTGFHPGNQKNNVNVTSKTDKPEATMKKKRWTTKKKK